MYDYRAEIDSLHSSLCARDIHMMCVCLVFLGFLGVSCVVAFKRSVPHPQRFYRGLNIEALNNPTTAEQSQLNWRRLQTTGVALATGEKFVRCFCLCCESENSEQQLSVEAFYQHLRVRRRNTKQRQRYDSSEVEMMRAMRYDNNTTKTYLGAESESEVEKMGARRAQGGIIWLSESNACMCFSKIKLRPSRPRDIASSRANTQINTSPWNQAPLDRRAMFYINFSIYKYKGAINGLFL